MKSGTNSRPADLYPLLLQPIFKYRIWGGRRLEKILGKKLPPDEPIGESWEVSCRDGDNSAIRNGGLAGQTLADALEANRQAVLGTSLAGAPGFPLLNKFIDANELLSVQAHPDERSAPRLGGEPKTEAWYIIHAEPGASLIKGLKPGVTRKTFEEAVRSDAVPDVLNSFPVSTGDMVFVPAGCVHAMGKGLVICEVQQNSDTTYRVYDWGRLGPDRKPRQLHIAQALECIDFGDRPPDKVKTVVAPEGANTREYLAACRYFAMQLLTLREPSAESTERRRFDSLMLIGGSAIIRTRDEETPIAAGDSALIPASVGDYTIEPLDRCALLKIFAPDIQADIVERLRSKGIAEEAVREIVFE